MSFFGGGWWSMEADKCRATGQDRRLGDESGARDVFFLPRLSRSAGHAGVFFGGLLQINLRSYIKFWSVQAGTARTRALPDMLIHEHRTGHVWLWSRIKIQLKKFAECTVKWSLCCIIFPFVWAAFPVRHPRVTENLTSSKIPGDSRGGNRITVATHYAG